MMWYGSPVDSVIFQGGTKPLLDSDVSLEEIAHDARCESFTWVSTLLSYIQMDEGCIVTNSRWCSGVVYLDWFHWLKAECVCVSEERICRRWCERHVLTLWEFTWAQDRHTHTQVTHTHITDESPALWSGVRHRSRSTRDLSLVTEPVKDIRVSRVHFEDAFKKVRPSVSKKVRDMKVKLNVNLKMLKSDPLRGWICRHIPAHTFRFTQWWL